MPSNCTTSFLRGTTRKTQKKRLTNSGSLLRKIRATCQCSPMGLSILLLIPGDINRAIVLVTAAIGAVERLEGSLYDVVPDDHETDGSTWELYENVQDRNYISTHDVALTVLQPPPHVRIVYRQKDPEQTRIHGKARPRGIERAGHQRVRPIKIVPVSSYHLVDRKQVGPNDTIV